MVTVYYSERNQIRISQGKRHVGQSPGHVQAQILQLSSPSGVVDRATFWQQCVTTHMKYCQRGKLLQALATRAFHKEMTDHPCGHLSFQPLWRLSLGPKDPTINPFVRNYLGGKGSQVNKGTLFRQDLPGAEGKSQTSLWTRLILYYTESPSLISFDGLKDI